MSHPSKHAEDAIGAFEDAIAKATGGDFEALLAKPGDLVEDEFASPSDVPEDTPDDVPEDTPADSPADHVRLDAPPRQDPRE